MDSRLQKMMWCTFKTLSGKSLRISIPDPMNSSKQISSMKSGSTVLTGESYTCYTHYFMLNKYLKYFRPLCTPYIYVFWRVYSTGNRFHSCCKCAMHKTSMLFSCIFYHKSFHSYYSSEKSRLCTVFVWCCKCLGLPN